MAAAVSNEQPEFLKLDMEEPLNHNVEENTKKKIIEHFNFILQFKCKCPEASEVRKLHPSIKNVYIPKRPASITYCVLHFPTQESCDEVRKALHGKHMDRYFGTLQCRDTTKNILLKLTGSSSEELKKTHFNRLDVQQLKRTRDLREDTLPDVECNSTARELLVRYGMFCVNTETWAQKSNSGSQRLAKKKENKRLKRKTDKLKRKHFKKLHLPQQQQRYFKL